MRKLQLAIVAGALLSSSATGAYFNALIRAEPMTVLNVSLDTFTVHAASGRYYSITGTGTIKRTMLASNALRIIARIHRRSEQLRRRAWALDNGGRYAR